MLSVKYSEIPSYLRQSQLCRALDENDTTSISIPNDCLKRNTNIYSTKDLVHFLKTTTFWILDVPHRDVLRFVLQTGFGSHSADSETWRLFHSYTFAADFVKLKEAKPCDRIGLAVTSSMSITIVKHLHELGHALPQDATSLAAQRGSMKLLQYFHTHGCALTNEGACYAARGGKLKMLKYFHSHDFQFDTVVGKSAAICGHLHCLRYVHKTTSNLDLTACALQACYRGHLECAMYLHEQGGEITIYSATVAARNHHFACVEYAILHGTPPATEMAVQACKAGNLRCLEVLVAHHCELSADVCIAAAASGHMDCLQYAFDHHAPLNHDAAAVAALHGHLDCLQYIHEQGGPWNGQTVAVAAWNGHEECVTYALAHGCPDGRIAVIFNDLVLIAALLYYILHIEDLVASIAASVAHFCFALSVKIAMYKQVLQQRWVSVNWDLVRAVLMLIIIVEFVVAFLWVLVLSALLVVVKLLRWAFPYLAVMWHVVVYVLKLIY